MRICHFAIYHSILKYSFVYNGCKAVKSFHIAKWNRQRSKEKELKERIHNKALHIAWWRDQNFNALEREREREREG
jgi:hypothetical protein